MPSQLHKVSATRLPRGIFPARRSWAWIAAILAMAAAPGRAAEANPTLSSLKKLSFEELMDIEVTSVSRRPEKLQDAAAAVQVVTSDEILRSGASSLPEALRLAGNLNVARKNAHDWGISAR